MPIPKNPLFAGHPIPRSKSPSPKTKFTLEVETVSAIPSVEVFRPVHKSSHTKPRTHNSDTVSIKGGPSPFRKKRGKFSLPKTPSERNYASHLSSSHSTSSPPFSPHTPTKTRSFSPQPSTDSSSSRPGSSPTDGALSPISPFSFIPNPIDAAFEYYSPTPEIGYRGQHFINKVEAKLDEHRPYSSRPTGLLTRNESFSSAENFVYE